MFRYNKPVWIVEFGAGNENIAQQKKLIDEAYAEFQAMGFSALLYLNIQDSNITGPNYKLANSDTLSAYISLHWIPQPAGLGSEPPHAITSSNVESSNTKINSLDKTIKETLATLHKY